MLKQWPPNAKTCSHIQKRWCCLGLFSWGLDLGREENREEEDELGFEGKAVGFVGCS
ncbi:hypothetical protein ACE6H2_017543 [Prunus campanulata]